MYAHPISPHSLRLPHFFTRWLAALFAVFLLALAAIPAHAAAPAAGASISNQASASYTDGSNVPRTVTSNVVSTTVTQVASLTLTAPGNQTATPGSVVYYPHTLTNTGNGSDTFNLTAVSAGTPFQMTNVQIFADNGSGQPTGLAITSTGPIAAGAAFKFIVVGTLPVTATATQTNVITVNGASALTPAQNASNIDTTTVTTNAVVTLTKAVSVASGPSPANAAAQVPYTYTLTYTNTGNSAATSVAISDVVPAGMTYVAGSARWSVTGGSTALSDTNGSSGTSPNTLTSSYTTGTKTFLATLAQVTPGQSGTLSFQVKVDVATAPGVINNTATTSYNNGSGANTGSGTSNTVPFTVTQTANVTLTGATVTSPAAPGSTVSFTNVVTNTGTGIDTFNITLGATNNFPSGTTFQLFKSGGATPLVDTNGDGIIDTGPLAVGASYNVILKATLPPNATNAGAPFSINKIATSVFDPTKSATTTDTLTSIANASVDLTNNSVAAAGVPGFGPGPEATAQVTNTTNPGTTTVFTLVANNTGPSPDSFNFSASTVSGFSSLTLPAGWTVTFKANVGGTCASTGANIINSGSVAAGGAVTVCAVVTVPAGFAAGTSDLYFRAQSPTSGVSDIVHDAVTVNAVRSLSITPNGAGQTYPGGSYVYSHTLTNNGNVAEGNGTVSAVALAAANNQSGWTSTLYYDSNGNGTLDATDPLITGALNAVLATGLAPGQSITIFDKVIAPSGSVPGAVNATVITVTTTNGTNNYVVAAPVPTVATDSTTVIAGNLTLTKAQSLDTACAGATGSTVYTSGNLNAKPGECVLYQITVTNVGSADATAVVVSDVTPTYTKLKNLAASSLGTVTGPSAGQTGAVTATIGTLTSSQAAVVTFGVQIDQ
ncbi:putative repeat protein (TIGR01451 family) [Polaromonas sp. CG_9.5]|uniref:beta strand repeat-containing protein n=1 Tax=Polaromonas sp. CG_9.5 TaxID=3071705 RepID=UPI002E056D71|nr:putative repeat protein (TIGR01451 family) [Polaromonas sp. CG_9.5]